MKSALVCLLLIVSHLAAGDIVVLQSGSIENGTITLIDKDGLMISTDDSTSKTIPYSKIASVKVASRERREYLLDEYSAMWRVTGVVPPVPIVAMRVSVDQGVPSSSAVDMRFSSTAGEALKSASSTALWGIGLAIGGSLAGGVLAGIGASVPAIITIGVTDIAALSCQIIAWTQIGRAGETLTDD
jgi:hypothetical protein